MREYLNTLRDIKTSEGNCENDIQLDSGLHNISAMHYQSILTGGSHPHNTNLDVKQ